MRSSAFLGQRISQADRAAIAALRRDHRCLCAVRFLSQEFLQAWALVQPVSVDAPADMNSR
eukprot:11679890-Alexandrium_andersonii.AAC.1